MDRMDQDKTNLPRQSGDSARNAQFARTAAGARMLAARLEGDPSTMAWVLARHREAEDQDDVLVALSLGIDPVLLPHLALCNRPREEIFRTDVETIAAHIGMDPIPLAELVRRVEALTGFGRRPAAGRGGILAAARDRAAEDSATYDVNGPSSSNTSRPSSNLQESTPTADGEEPQ